VLLFERAMIDYFSLALSHGVLLLAFWRLMLRDDLDAEPPREVPDEVAEPEPESAGKRLRRA
jgi:hypothetical protein